MTIPPLPPPPGDAGPEYPRPQGVQPFPPHQYGSFYGQENYQPPASKTMAGWALGLSILNCFSIGVLVAIGLAIAVLVKSQRDGRNHGKGLAIAALIISSLWIMGFVVLFVLAFTGRIEIDDTKRDESGEITEEQAVSPTLLREGDCVGVGEVDEMLSDAQYEVTAVPCAEPHSGEVYHVFELADGDYPGDGEVARLAETGCFDAFRDFVGVAPRRSTLAVTLLHPQSVGWRITGDRDVMCIIGETDGTTTGTLEGTRR